MDQEYSQGQENESETEHAVLTRGQTAEVGLGHGVSRDQGRVWMVQKVRRRSKLELCR